MAHILIIDDDPDFCYSLLRTVKRMDHTALTCGTIAEARKRLVGLEIDAVFLDVRLPDGNGLSLLGEINNHQSEPETIIITGAGDSEGAEIALTNGAWDYIDKTTSAKDIGLILKRALQYRSERKLASVTGQTVALRRDVIIGDSSSISACFDLVAQSAVSDVNVVVTGETGTGKELFARAIHDNSSRSTGPFVVVDCASLSQTLTESILFGHKKGSFTGADSNKAGLVSEAAGGTLFLDEIGELPLATQKSFLRVLQEKTLRPVGSHEEVEIDFRLVAATNRNLEEMVAGGTFRSDLFFRLQSMQLHLPPLRKRLEDIEPIATYHINRLCDEMGMERKGVSGSFFESLDQYDWPGNVRELVNCLEQAIVSAGGEPVLYPKHLPVKLRVLAKQASFGEQQEPDSGKAADDLVIPIADAAVGQQSLQEFREIVFTAAEKKYLSSLLKSCKGSVREAIQISGVSQSRFYALLKKYNLKPDRK